MKNAGQTEDNNHELGHDPSMLDEEASVECELNDLCIIGEKKSCVEQLEEFCEFTGGFGTTLMLKHVVDDAERWRQCMRTVTEEIVPAMPTVGDPLATA